MSDQVLELDGKPVDQVMDTDVVVVGGGGGGTWAALQLARHGAGVIVLEKGATYLWSNTANIGGTTFCNSRIQKEQGIEIDTMALFKHMMKFAEGGVNGKIVKRYLDESHEMIDYWLDLGAEVMMGDDRYDSGFVTVHFFLQPNKMELLRDDAVSKGAQFIYNTSGKKIIMDGDRAVGVLAQNKDGEVIQINAKYVVIATGGFLHNPEMMKRYFGAANKIHPAGMPGPTGDGIKMALEAGAIMDTNFALSTLSDMSGYNAKYSKIAQFTNYRTRRFETFIFANTGTMLVDNQGKRFINEFQLATSPLAYGSAILARTGYYYAIFNQALVDYYHEHTPFDRIGRDEELWKVGPIMFDRVQEMIYEDLQTAIDEGFAWKADSVAELQEMLEMDSLVETVDNYNAMYDAGADTEFGCERDFMIPVKEGPYYAVQFQCGALVTMGGIKTDDICRALNEDNRPVPGLFVVSSDNGSAFSSPYYDIGGTSSGLAMATGYIAGNEIAKMMGLSLKE
ncbi:MAG: FAD-dependent oxidoreductase [bacterium]|nr:FAD-dependent oxidoreductase [bacterium]